MITREEMINEIGLTEAQAGLMDVLMHTENKKYQALVEFVKGIADGEATSRGLAIKIIQPFIKQSPSERLEELADGIVITTPMYKELREIAAAVREMEK